MRLELVLARPGLQEFHRMEQVLHAMDDDRRARRLGKVQDALHPQQVLAGVGGQDFDEQVEGLGADRLVADDAIGADPRVVAVDVMGILARPAGPAIVAVMVVPAMWVTVCVEIGFGLQPAQHIGMLGGGIIDAGVEQPGRVHCAALHGQDRRRGIQRPQPRLQLFDIAP